MQHEWNKVSNHIRETCIIPGDTPADLCVWEHCEFFFLKNGFYCFEVVQTFNSNSTLINKLFLLQKRVIRILSGVHYLAHTDPLFRQIGIIKIKDLFTFFSSIFIYRIKNNLYPPSFNQKYFELVSPNNSFYNTRAATQQLIMIMINFIMQKEHNMVMIIIDRW